MELRPIVHPSDDNFHVHTVHLDNYLFFHQMMHNWIVLKTSLICIKIDSKTLFRCETPPSGSTLSESC
jgi:hypothetical protein